MAQESITKWRGWIAFPDAFDGGSTLREKFGFTPSTDSSGVGFRPGLARSCDGLESGRSERASERAGSMSVITCSQQLSNLTVGNAARQENDDMLFRFSRLKGRPLECVAWRNIYYLYWLGAVLKRLRRPLGHHLLAAFVSFILTRLT